MNITRNSYLKRSIIILLKRDLERRNKDPLLHEEIMFMFD